MSQFTKMDRDRERKNYWEGPQNRLIRLWVYSQRGLQEVNEFKYFILAFASGVALLYTSLPLKLVIIIAAIGIPLALSLLIVFGRWQLRKAAKVDQWVSTEFGSVLKYNEYNIRVETLNTLEAISKKLDKLLKEANNNASKK